MGGAYARGIDTYSHVCIEFWLTTCQRELPMHVLSQKVIVWAPVFSMRNLYSKLEHSVCQSRHLILRFNQATKLTYNIQDYRSVTTRYYSWFGRSDRVGGC